MKRLQIVLALCLPFLPACFDGCGAGGEGEGEGEGEPNLDPKVAYPVFTSTTRSEVVRTAIDGSTGLATLTPGATVTIGGASYTEFSGSASTGSTSVAAAVSNEEVVVAQAEGDSSLTATIGLPSTFSAAFDPPLVIPLVMDVGVEVTIPIQGELLMNGGAEPVVMDTEAHVTVVDADIAVDTAMGTQQGCATFVADGVSNDLFGAPTLISGGGVFCPRFGLVSGAFDAPDSIAQVGLDLLGSSDAVDLGGGYTSVYRAGVIGAGGLPSFALATSDAHGLDDADKQTHAKMYLEMRWVDDARAQTNEAPPVTPSFQTRLGYFSADAPEAQDASFFYPDENGEGYVTWAVLVDQAAKNEAENGIAYVINASTFGDPVRVTARIIYKTWSP